MKTALFKVVILTYMPLKNISYTIQDLAWVIESMFINANNESRN